MKILKNEVHLWCVYDEEISDPELLRKYYALLNKEEKAQKDRYYFPRNRHQYLITRALVRTVLSQYFSAIDPTELIFKTNAYGKPYIANPSISFPLEFNISHTEKLITLAVTNGVKVGVDVEYNQRNSNLISIAERFFSPSEIDDLNLLDLKHKHDRFFDLWTLKEAYIKAKSLGLSIPLDKFCYRFKDKNTINIHFDDSHIIDKPSNWQFFQLIPNEFHKIAIALTDSNIQNNKHLLVIRETVPLVSSTTTDYDLTRTG